jgi:hypothetical protein
MPTCELRTKKFYNICYWLSKTKKPESEQFQQERKTAVQVIKPLYLCPRFFGNKLECLSLLRIFSLVCLCVCKVRSKLI